MLKSVTIAYQRRAYYNLFFQSTILEKVLASRSVISRRNFYLLSHNCLYNYNARHFVDKTSKIEKQADLIRFWEEYRARFIQHKRCVSKLVELLQCEEEEAKKLVYEEPQMFVEDIDVTEKKIDLLIAAGVTPNVIRINIPVLRIALSRLESYLSEMKRWNIDECYFHEFLPMLNETPENFFRISQLFIKDIKKFPYGNRIVYLAKRLDCSVSEVLSKTLRKRFLLRKSFKSCEDTLNVFKEFGIKNEDILADLLCFMSSPVTTRARLTELQKIGYHPLKPWLARTNDYRSEKAIKHFLARKEIERCKSYEEFIATKLEMDTERVMELKEQIQRKYPYFFRIRALTFLKKLEFLLNAGYIPKELLDYPYIFQCKISTLNDRILALQKLGVHKPRLSLLSKGRSAFDQCVTSLLSNRNEKFYSSNYRE